jgi:TPR repeat protein
VKTAQQLLATLAAVIILVFFSIALTNCKTSAKAGHSDTETFEETLAKSEQGDASSQNKLGRIYSLGLGVAEDQVEAVKWYRKAAEQGNILAQYELGACYAGGQGIEKNDIEAVKWYRKAAERGNLRAQKSLSIHYSTGLGVEKDKAESMKWSRKAAEQGDAFEQWVLGSQYSMGDRLVENEDDFVRWRIKNSVLEIPVSVMRDREAVKWYRRAAEQGFVWAQRDIGECYVKGKGVVKNELLAYQWYLLASANGDETASNDLPALEAKLTPELRVEGQSLATEWQAAFEKRQAEQ